MTELLILAAIVAAFLLWRKLRPQPRAEQLEDGHRKQPVGQLPGLPGQRRDLQPPERSGELLSQPLDPAMLTTVLTLLAGGSKLGAISQLRHTGLGQAAARMLVEAIQAGHRPPLTGQPLHVEEERLPDLATRARQLHDDGRVDDAVRLVSAETGMGEVDALRFLRALGEGPR